MHQSYVFHIIKPEKKDPEVSKIETETEIVQGTRIETDTETTTREGIITGTEIKEIKRSTGGREAEATTNIEARVEAEVEAMKREESIETDPSPSQVIVEWQIIAL